MKPVVLAAIPDFAAYDPAPRAALEKAGWEIRENRLGRRLVREDYPSLLSGAAAVLAGLEPYDAAVFAANPDLRVVSRIGIGLDAIDLAAARARGVEIRNTPEAPSVSVAEHAIAMIFALLRDIPAQDRDVHAGRWMPRVGRELAGRRVGLLGFGRIGRLVAARLVPFGAILRACDEVWDAAVAASLGVERRDRDALLRESEILSIHLPLGPATRGLLDGARLDLLPPGAYVVNTSRGGILDDGALCERLRAGRLAGAALDVLADEPDPSRVAGTTGLVLTPHVGSFTREAWSRMEREAVENLLRTFEARPT